MCCLPARSAVLGGTPTFLYTSASLRMIMLTPRMLPFKTFPTTPSFSLS